ncbi:MAG TPA: YciK family oxidoreductase [Pseudomonadales bacterium]
MNTPLLDYQAPADLLRDRIIMVTGASDGIGRAMAEGFARFGATVILHGRDTDKLDAVYDGILEAGGAEPAILPLDFKTLNTDLAEQAHDWVQDTFGKLDGLLHNAALLGDRSPIESYKPHVWNDVMQVNLNAPFLLTHSLLPLLRLSDDASIIFTSSSVGRKGRAYWGAYAVSKFGIEGLMQTLADELENTSHVRVNSLNPGATNTAMRRTAYPGEHPDVNPLPETLLPAFLYLMGKDSKGVTGQALDVR